MQKRYRVGANVEILIAFLIKFIGVIVGTISGLISSIPFVKEWIAISKIDIAMRGGELEMTNAGTSVLVIVDGQAVWDGGTMTIPRLLMRQGQAVGIAADAHGQVRVWLKIVDIHSGREMTVAKQVLKP